MRLFLPFVFILSMAMLAFADERIGDVRITVSAKKRTTFYVLIWRNSIMLPNAY